MPYHGRMNERLNPIEQACALVGSAAELARRLRVASPTISQWSSGFDDESGRMRDMGSLSSGAKWRPVPERRCPAVEFETSGVVAVERLRSDVKWVRVPDPSWPHPEGRPCIDTEWPPVSGGDETHAGSLHARGAAVDPNVRGSFV